MAKSSLPMPVDVVMDHPSMRVAGAIVASSVLNLAVRYWLSGCKPLPAEAHDRMVLARTNSPAWLRHGDAIDAITAEILPLLSTARDAKLAGLEDRRARAARAMAKQRLAGNAPHLSPHHPSRRKRGASVASMADAAAYAALDAAGITDRRLSAAELAEGATIVSRDRVAALPHAGAAGMTGGGGTGLGHATATAKPKSGLRETTKR